MADTIIFLYLVIFPFGQLFRLNLNIFHLVITLQPIDVVSLVALSYTIIQRNKLPHYFRYIFYFLISSLFSFLLFSVFYPSKLLLPGLLYFFRLVANLGFIPFVLNNFKDEKKRLGILNSLMAVIVVVGIFGWIQYFLLPDFRPFKIWGWDDHLFRLIGTFLDPTYIGLILVFGVTMALIKYHESREKNLLILMLYFLITIAFTYSRASYLALVGGLIVYALWQKKYFVPLLVVIIFGITIALLPQPSSEGVQLERTSSIYGRFRSYSEGLIIFKYNSVFGVGFNNYCYARQIYLKTNDLSSHACSGSDSSLLNILVTTGVVGFFIFIRLLISIYKRVKQDKYGIIFVICSAALFIHSFFSNSLFYTWILSFMAILTGLVSRSNEG